MHALITGVAGFIGSALAKALSNQGHTVCGIDNFLDSYPRVIKEDRLKGLLGCKAFSFIEGSLVDVELDELVEGVDCIFHLAAQAGVRTSWGQRFEVYTESNILATQKLLEVAKSRDVDRFIYSSSSSVYGDTKIFPTHEDTLLKPVSPYAVSKLAGEHLCDLYRQHFAVPTVILRYFTVYGPQPRPDQAVCIFTRALLEGRRIEVFGDGEQLRGMTYLGDVVRANLLAAEMDCVGEVFNIGGGTSITVNELIHHLELITQKKAILNYTDAVKGDARNTLADITRVQKHLGWSPEMDIVEGLRQTVESVRNYYY